MKSIKDILVVFGLAACMAGCNNTASNNQSNETAEVDVVEEDEDSMIVAENEDSVSTNASAVSPFQRQMLDNRAKMSDEKRCNKLASAAFWSADTLSLNQYALLFNYLLEHQDEKYDDQIADFLFEYYSKAKHFDEFDFYYNMVEPRPVAIFEPLTYYLTTSWYNEKEVISETDFKRKFGYLYDNGGMKFFREIKGMR